MGYVIYFNGTSKKVCNGTTNSSKMKQIIECHNEKILRLRDEKVLFILKTQYTKQTLLSLNANFFHGNLISVAFPLPQSSKK